MNEVSESFVSSVVHMLLLSGGKFSLWLWFSLQILDSGHKKPPDLKDGLGLFHFFRLKLRIL